MLLLLSGCALLGVNPPPEGPVAPSAATAAATALDPVSFAPLEQRVNVLLAEADDADRRDRLIVLRELMLDMRNTDPAAQRKVYVALERLVSIEERARPQPLPQDGGPETIEQEPIETGASLEPARKALAEARYLDAVAALEGNAAPEARVLHKEAVDAWAREERERAGHLFLEAREVPAGDERAAAMKKARDVLAGINTRFPDNAYAAQIRDHIAKVDAELATP